MKMYNPPHPGFVLKEYIEGMKIGEVAKKLGAEMAIRIGLALNTSPNMWLSMQGDYDLWQIEHNKTFSITPWFPHNPSKPLQA